MLIKEEGIPVVNLIITTTTFSSMFVAERNTNLSIFSVVIDGGRKKVEAATRLEIQTAQQKKKTKIARLRKKMKLGSILDPLLTIKACCVDLSLFGKRSTE